MRKSARRRRRGTRTRQDLLNEILRPNPYLGYAEDNIGAHLLECEAYETAERFFRQAVWVNPYEPQFRVHLARSLYDQPEVPRGPKCPAGSASVATRVRSGDQTVGALRARRGEPLNDRSWRKGLNREVTSMSDVRASVVIVQEASVLLIRHRRRGRVYWVIPGGRVRDYETLDAAAVREIREETGLEIRPGPLVAAFQIRERWSDMNEHWGRHVVELVFLAESFTGIQTPPVRGPLVEPFDRAEFVDPGTLSTLDMRPLQIRPFLQQLATGVRPVPRYLGDLMAEALEEKA